MFDTKNAHFGQPNDAAISQARQSRDFVIVGKGADGKVTLWATGNQQQTEALLREAAPAVLEPAD
jgi:hypothetical protein